MEYIKIDKNLPIPLHIQLARSIRIAIQDGLLLTNTKLPTEDELGQKYDLSNKRLNDIFYDEKLYSEDYSFGNIQEALKFKNAISITV